MALSTDRFITASLADHPMGASIARILSSAINAVGPDKVIRDSLSLNETSITICNTEIEVNPRGRIYLIGAGKASATMAASMLSSYSDRIFAGYVITKDGYSPHQYYPTNNNVKIAEASHPLPDQRGRIASKELLHLVERLMPEDTVICLLSGGGSALLFQPPPSISVDEYRQVNNLLLRSGANIQEFNTVRKHLDLIKGGGLARHINPAQLIVVIISDVIRDQLDVIASGPCSPDPSTYQDALNIIMRYDLESKIPGNVLDYLHRGAKGMIKETPKEGNPIFSKVHYFIVANLNLAVSSAVNQARVEGFTVHLITTKMKGEARVIGRTLAQIVKSLTPEVRKSKQPICLILGGETTVTVTGQGLGGRNQELALAAVNDLAGQPDVILVTLATDGSDGPTDAAGAVVTGYTLSRAQALGLDPEQYLFDNNSYKFFNSLGDLLKPGPTYTNVNDLIFVFIK